MSNKRTSAVNAAERSNPTLSASAKINVVQGVIVLIQKTNSILLTSTIYKSGRIILPLFCCFFSWLIIRAGNFLLLYNLKYQFL